MANDLFAHTINIRNWISVREVENLCNKYGVQCLNEFTITGIKIAGINQLNFKRNLTYPNGKKVDRYDMEIQINLGRLLKKSTVAMVAVNNKSVTAMIQKLNKILSSDFGLNMKHTDSSKWNISRFDCGIDLRLCTDNPTVLREYIRLLHDSFDVENSRNISFSNYKTNKNWDDIRHESITLSTQGESTNEQRYKYNIYYKLQQLMAYAHDKGIILTNNEIKEIKDVIRIEKQIYQVDKVFKRSSKLASLLDENLTEKLMAGIVKEMQIMFGYGNYLSDKEALSV